MTSNKADPKLEKEVSSKKKQPEADTDKSSDKQSEKSSEKKKPIESDKKKDVSDEKKKPDSDKKKSDDSDDEKKKSKKTDKKKSEESEKKPTEKKDEKKKTPEKVAPPSSMATQSAELFATHALDTVKKVLAKAFPEDEKAVQRFINMYVELSPMQMELAVHSPDKVFAAKCSGKTKDGLDCKSKCKKGSDKCANHSGDKKKKKKAKKESDDEDDTGCAATVKSTKKRCGKKCKEGKFCGRHKAQAEKEDSDEE